MGALEKEGNTTQRLHERLAAYLDGHITFGEFDASVQGWINHVSFADSWGLREHVLKDLTLTPRANGTRRLRDTPVSSDAASQ